MSKARLALSSLAAIAFLSLLGGCGGGGSSGDPAAVAPPDAPVFVEAKVRPTGELREDVEGIARRVAGVEDLGGAIVSLVEKDALDSDEPLDYQGEVEPWLGERAGIFLTGFDGNDFQGGGLALQVTDTDEAQAFVERRSASQDPRPEDESYEGHDYKLDPEGGQAVGLIGEFLVVAGDRASFEAAVDASKGDSLAGAERYEEIAPQASEGSLANVYVDVGGLIDSAGARVDPDAQRLFEAIGVELDEGALLASLVPGPRDVEIQVASNLTKETEGSVSGGTAELLGSMPAGSAVALGIGDLGKSAGRVVDRIDQDGIPGQLPPGRFKSTLKRAGIDIEGITQSLGDAALFVRGRSRATLEGALVIESRNGVEARNTVANIGTLLRASGTPGVTAVTGSASGFSVRSRDLGRRPIVVAAKGGRIAVGYGLAPVLAGLGAKPAPDLSKTAAYNEALDALGETPITGFAARVPLLRLLEGLIADSGDRERLQQLAPYLSRVPFLAIGSETQEDVGRLRLVLGVTR